VLAHKFAMEHPMISAEMVEATDFMELSEEFGVSSVPHTVINLGKGELIGAPPESLLLEEIRKALKE